VPPKRLLDHVARVIRREPVFTLLDEQPVAFNAIMDAVGAAGHNQQSVAFLVKGGPGTGKSVIAVNLIAELSARGLRSLHLTGSKAFTENLRGVVGQPAGALFKYFRDTATIDEQLDVAVLDEAHRIRTVRTSRFTPAKHRTGKAQIDVHEIDAAAPPAGRAARLLRSSGSRPGPPRQSAAETVDPVSPKISRGHRPRT